MRIEGPDGSRFELSLLGWQHPHGASNEIDANRLRVRIALATEEGAFAEITPGLVAWEAERLAEWLEALAAHRAAESEQRFLEPDLRFRISPASGVARLLRIGIDLRARRPGREAPVGEVCFALDEDALGRAARTLRAQIRRFPPREAS
ncbi:hypothetical protein MYXO_02981 [Myxococcaceae bacterium]|jgi:hypothetical protein|nr:hypothetical protein MYXO_02981 [Myxococcaceae bacterium]